MFTIKLYREETRYVHRARSYAATPTYLNLTMPDRNDKGQELFLRLNVVGPDAYDRIEVLNDSGAQVDLLVPPEVQQMQIDEPPPPPPPPPAPPPPPPPARTGRKLKAVD